jgi:hypothetical protein
LETFRTKTLDCTAVAGRYLRGLAQAEDCTFTGMTTVVDEGCAQTCGCPRDNITTHAKQRGTSYFEMGCQSRIKVIGGS